MSPAASPSSLQLPAPGIPAPLWTPPAHLPTHAGLPSPADAVFFVSPPAEIGEVFSAQTDVFASKPPRRTAVRALVASLASLPGVALIVGSSYFKEEEAILAFFSGLLLAMSLSLLAWVKGALQGQCSYVGKLGAIQYRYRNSLRPKVTLKLLFYQAAELRTSSTRTYVNGSYLGTNYNFVWTDRAGRRLLNLKGIHFGQQQLPKPTNPYHFALSTEMAWSFFLLDRAADELANHGALSFTISSDKVIRVGPGFVEFVWGKETQRIESADIGKLDLSEGMFRIHHKDARWFSFSGKYAFEYGKIPNARLFLLALDRFVNLNPTRR